MSDEEVEYDEVDIDDDDELDDDDEEDDEYVQEEEDGTIGDAISVNDEDDTIPMAEYKTKFSNEMRNDYIKTYHPEEIHKPFDEIYQLSHVKRNEEGYIILQFV